MWIHTPCLLVDPLFVGVALPEVNKKPYPTSTPMCPASSLNMFAETGSRFVEKRAATVFALLRITSLYEE